MVKRKYYEDSKRKYILGFPCTYKKCEDNTNGLCTSFNYNITCMGECETFKTRRRKK